MRTPRRAAGGWLEDVELLAVEHLQVVEVRSRRTDLCRVVEKGGGVCGEVKKGCDVMHVEGKGAPQS